MVYWICTFAQTARILTSGQAAGDFHCEEGKRNGNSCTCLFKV
jgi:hypothetical protein